MPGRISLRELSVLLVVAVAVTAFILHLYGVWYIGDLVQGASIASEPGQNGSSGPVAHAITPTSQPATSVAGPSPTPVSTTEPGAAPTAQPTQARATPEPTPTPFRLGDGFQKGMSILVYKQDYVGIDELRRNAEIMFARVAGLGVNSVAIVFPILLDTATSNEIYADSKLTPTQEDLQVLVQIAHQRGLAVSLRPLIDERRLGSDWRATIRPADVSAWFRSYSSLLVGYARLAELEGVELYSIGSEMSSMEKHTDEWRALIADIRGVYEGKLIYSTNWDTKPNDVGFWGDLDYIGMDIFFPLGAPENATVSDLVAAWQTWLNALRAFREAAGKPLVITEIGVTAQQRSFMAPYRPNHNTRTSQEDQRLFYEAACVALPGSVDAGLYWWQSGLYIPNPLTDRSFNPLGKTAEQEMRRCFTTGGF